MIKLWEIIAYFFKNSLIKLPKISYCFHKIKYQTHVVDLVTIKIIQTAIEIV